MAYIQRHGASLNAVTAADRVGHFISVGADERAPHLVDGAIKDFERY
jgi:hypothetical protein